jgi:hypothetical protein
MKKFPGYDVLAKRTGPSWNDKTREVVERRLALGPSPRFFTAEELLTVEAAADRIVPQPNDRPAIPVALLVDHKLHLGQSDGYRLSGTPQDRDAWRQGLKAMDAEAMSAWHARFHALSQNQQDCLLQRMQDGALQDPVWYPLHPSRFFKMRLAKDLVFAYYAHPTAWSEIGWGGPASPRGYVRMDYDERDPWEAAEAHEGTYERAQRKNRHVS